MRVQNLMQHQKRIYSKERDENIQEIKFKGDLCKPLVAIGENNAT
jgi:hypothetical protein